MSTYIYRFTCLLVGVFAPTALGCSVVSGEDRDNGLDGGTSGGGGASAAAAAAAATTQTTGGITMVSAGCGDGKKVEAEECDDGNKENGDGCNQACQIELDYECPVENTPCVSTVVCGNGILSSVETCDDGNTADGDGCSADCSTVEPGWQCRVPGKACVPVCGDMVLTGSENCDDGNAVSGDGCSSTCLTEPGYSCVDTVCTAAVCGNGVVETGESCDLGAELNGLFYGDGSGCSKTCTQEPQCRDGSGVTVACSTACGDGNIDTADGEACDDGNAVDGDGCSSTCQLEGGFTCEDVESPDTETCASGAECLVLPIIYRDFDGEHESGGHPDFYYLGHGGRNCVPNASGQQDDAAAAGMCWASDSTDLCQGIVAEDLAADGKPAIGSTTMCNCRYTDWEPGELLTTGTTCNSGGEAQPRFIEKMVPAIDSAASFNQWYHDDPSVNTTVPGTLELTAIAGNLFQFSSSDGETVYDDLAEGEGTTLDSGFFPLEDQPRAKVCNIWPYWIAENTDCDAEDGESPWEQWDPALNDGGGGRVSPVTGIERNFYFTSEVRYLFRFVGGETLSFYGDDDVFVFINGKLALDLGAPHERLAGDVTLPAAGGTSASWVISAIDPVDGTTLTVGSGMSPALGLEAGKIYEIAIFHADRHPRESNYQLTLQGFSTNKSQCVPTCGDGVATTGEECDDGAANSDTAYGGCTTECKFGPFCGDGVVDAGYEQCDAGRDNTAQYGEEGCAPGCVLPHKCGDGLIDGAFGEQCDDGANNGVGACQSDCTLQVK